MNSEPLTHSRFCSCAACGPGETTAAPPLDRDTLLAYARHVYDRSGWKTSRYGDPTVRVLILPDRLLPVRRPLAEIDFALTAYAARIAALAAPLNLLGGSMPAPSAAHRLGVVFTPAQRAAISELTAHAHG